MRTMTAAVLTLLTLAATVRADDSYTFALTRGLRPNTTYDVHFTESEKTTCTATVDGKPVAVPDHRNWEEQDRDADLTGQLSDFHADPKQNLRRFTFTIKRLTNFGRDSIRPGTVLEVEELVEKVRMRAKDGKPLPDNAKPLLVNFFANMHATGPSLDDLLAAGTPRKAGESWPLPQKLAHEYLAAERVRVVPASVTGSATLVGPDKLGDLPAVKVTMDLAAKDVGIDRLPLGAMIESSTMQIHFAFVAPADLTQPIVSEEKGQLTFNMVNSNSIVRLAGIVTRSRNLVLTPAAMPVAAGQTR